ncbi:WcbI family polysaccharide biosynthesis putative acetyltransferase [Psychrobacter sp.]|uniref:WcbI family polysaccharide biosynthesis putative acetyltransferase n=1 Tax=Psychrobacter sp. TaxID=56811 RepID=UPI00356AB4BB
MTTKKTAYIVGNCQAKALETVLNLSDNFRSYFEFSLLPAVHVIKPEQVQQLHEELPSAGLLIGQFVTEQYRDGIGLGLQTLQELTASNSINLSWPSMYFNGYNPELFYFKNKNGSSFNESFDYHHKVIYSGFIRGLSVSEVSESISNTDRFNNAAMLAQKSLDELSVRESDLDLKVAQFVTDNFRTERLFWTFNHPSSSVIAEIARQVLERLEIKNDLPNIMPDKLLNNTIYPILPSVEYSLKLNFQRENSIVVRGNRLSEFNMINEYYSIYRKYPELVEKNMNILNSL